MRYLLLLLFLIPWDLQAQELPALPWPITSDYGPRNYPGYKWHWGIDYDGEMWAPIQAVEGGTIVAINHITEGWYIRTSGQRYWTYFHIFNNSAPYISPAPDRRYELRQATLVDPDNIKTPKTRNIIIFWSNRANNRAEKILSSEEGAWWVETGNPTAPYILNNNANNPANITTQNTVAQGEIIAPMGNSGVTPVPPGDGSHLHLACSSQSPAAPLWYDINPLYYIQHDAPAYTVNILHPAAEDVLYHRPGVPEPEQLNERVRLNVKSSIGTDLDRVKFYFFEKQALPAEPVFDDLIYSTGIVYGGLPPGLSDSDPMPSYIKISGNNKRGSFSKTGVSPIGGMGDDDFYLIGFNTRAKQDGPGDALLNSEAKFPDGEYVLAARAHSIRHNNMDVFFDTSTNVTFDNFRPYVSRPV